MEIITGLHQISLGFVNAFAINHDSGVTLVDAGFRGHAQRILDYLARIGQRAEAVTHLIVTHADYDHIGGLAELKHRTGAEVVAHRLEAPVIEGRDVGRQAGSGLMGRLLSISLTVGHRLWPVAPVRVDRAVEDGAELPGGIRLVHTPGHSPGHLVVYLPDRRALIAGDLLNHYRKLGTVPKHLLPDPAALPASLQRVAELDFDVLVFSHGSPIRSGAAAQVRALARSINHA